MPRIAVVEDDPTVREMLVDALVERDHEVTAYDTIAAAYAGLCQAEPDLLVCDVDLPDGSGLDLIARVRKVHPRLPVLIQSGRDVEEDLLEGFAAGADDYITKPVSIHELQAKCAVMLAKAAKQSEPVTMGAELPGGATQAFGRYQILGILGVGGFGTVYDAQDLQTDQAVALKVLPAIAGLDDVVRQRFVREAYALSLLEHPNLARIYDFGAAEGRSYYSMERVPGPTLRDVVEERGPLPAEDVVGMLRILVDVLGAVHAKGLVHRDLKPANVVLRNESALDPVLIDFGLAKHPGDRTVTRTGEVIGSPHYLSPEQILNKPLTVACDQFSLGLVARFALVGADVWPDRELMDLLRGLASQPIPLPGKVPESMHGVLRRMTRILPEQRYPSWEELLAALPGS